MKTITKFTCHSFAALALVCVAALSTAQAVTPPPDGGYPNFTTAEGENALHSLTTGAGNTGIGWYSLKSNTDGSFNTAVGAGTLVLNVGDQSMGEGLYNTAIGAAALLLNTTGNNNTAVGAFALFSNTIGSFNAANGAAALRANTTGSSNVANGDGALASNTTGNFNVANGVGALNSNTTASNNVANGTFALFANTTGGFNVANGTDALSHNTTGNENLANGNGALQNNTTANSNVANGNRALFSNTTGGSNTAVGRSALESNTTGSSNVAVGVIAGFNATTGDNNVYIGPVVGVAGESNACYIASIYNEISGGGAPVYVNSSNKLGTPTSSRRFKEDIKPMERASEALLALKPVTFRFKKEIDPDAKSQFGLVAEDVEKVNPDLVVHDKEGKPYAVRFDSINAMLLNEFLKEHRAVQELKSNAAKQEATIARQQKQIEALTAGLQKVSAQLELSKAAPQTVKNNG